ncbi:MAG: Fe-S cluster assembly protein SufD [Pseudomonadota bacterium]
MSASLIQNASAFDAGIEAAFVARSAPNEAQAAAFDRFSKMRLPNRRLEGWRWSDFSAALRAAEFEDATGDVAIAPSAFADLEPLEIQIVNGRVILPEESTVEGAAFGVIDSMATIPDLETHAIVSLNVAMNRKAFGLQVDDGVILARPILIRHIVDSGAPVFAQTLLRIGVGANVQLIETYEGEGAPLYSHLCHMALRDKARFHRFVLQDTGPRAVMHALCAPKVDGGAHFDQTTLSIGARLARHETVLHYVAENAFASIDSAALLKDERHSDISTYVLHKAEACETRQVHKGVARDRGRNVFQGKFHVERPAQKTDAKMTANALLLSEGAEANHKPELEIYADDVECAHGSTVGALDDDALFYLRQRGLDEASARALLVEAFVGEVIESIENDDVREVFAARVADWLAQS